MAERSATTRGVEREQTVTESWTHSGIDVNDVIEIAIHAGELVATMRAAGLQDIRNKSSASDIVTEADVASEKLLRAELAALGPSYGFWGEESNLPPDEAVYWIVDPIDGTNNFAMGLPLYAVNIALCDGPDAVLGVTLAMPSRTIYWSTTVGGAWQRAGNGRDQALHVSPATRLDQVFLTTGFPYHRAEHADNNSAEHTYMLSRAQGLRCLGSSAMDLVFVASGALGGYWEPWIKPWDAAPGALLIREAGGRVTNYDGDDWTLTDHTIVASNGQPDVHDGMLDAIRTARESLEESLM